MAPNSGYLHTLFLLSLLLMLLSPGANSAKRPPDRCLNDTNYTAGSTYQANLNLLLSSLLSNTTATGHFNDTRGRAPDRTFGLAQCRGDTTPTECRTCLNSSISDMLQRCPSGRSSAIWYDQCFVRYSDQNFVSTGDSVYRYFWWNNRNATDPTEFNSAVGSLLDNLTTTAVGSASLFADGSVIQNFDKIYGLVQCTRDLSANECNSCLRTSIADIPNYFAGKIGGRVYGYSCIVRYELYQFYDTPAAKTGDAADPPSISNTTGSNQGSSSKTIKIVLIISIPVVVALVLFSAICVVVRRRRSTVRKQRAYGLADHDIGSSESLALDLATIKAATNNFSDENKLGEGGFGAVYKGLLEDGQEIAVKRLSNSSGQGLLELRNEVVFLAKLQHRNLVRLLGCCIGQEEKLLIYEYLPNTSLEKFLFDPIKREQLHWETRYKIIEGIARGLLYLHEDSRLKIIHRDLKASNILLDGDKNPKISDFGLAKLFSVDETQGNTSRIAGTYGYMAPEYAMHGIFSTKSDVFAYGVLILEIVTGQQNAGFQASGHAADLLSYVWQHWIEGMALQVKDQSLRSSYNAQQVSRCIHIALLCVQEDPAQRPSMASIALMLSSYSVTLPAPSTPAFFLGGSRISASDVRERDRDLNSFESQQSSRNIRLSDPNVSVNDVTITHLDPR